MKKYCFLFLLPILLFSSQLRASEIKFIILDNCYQRLVGDPGAISNFRVLPGQPFDLGVSYIESPYYIVHYEMQDLNDLTQVPIVIDPNLGMDPISLYPGAKYQVSAVLNTNGLAVTPVNIEVVSPAILFGPLDPSQTCSKFDFPVQFPLNLDGLKCVEYDFGDGNSTMQLSHIAPMTHVYDDNGFCQILSNYFACVEKTVTISLSKECDPLDPCVPYVFTQNVELCCNCPTYETDDPGGVGPINAIALSPNPTTGPTIITFDDLPTDGTFSFIQIVSANTGIAVIREENLPYSGSTYVYGVDLSAEPSGVYLVQGLVGTLPYQGVLLKN